MGHQAEKLAELPVLAAGDQELPQNGPAEVEKQVPLRIPDVSLDRQKLRGVHARQFRRPPFENLVQRAAAQAAQGHHQEEPASGAQPRLPQENLAGEDGRDEASDQMHDAVEVIAGQPQGVPQPDPGRDRREGVVTADREEHRVHEDQPIGQPRQTEVAEGRDQNGNAEEDGGLLQEPRQAISRRDSGNHEREREDSEKDDRLALGRRPRSAARIQPPTKSSRTGRPPESASTSQITRSLIRRSHHLQLDGRRSHRSDAIASLGGQSSRGRNQGPEARRPAPRGHRNAGLRRAGTTPRV